MDCSKFHVTHDVMLLLSTDRSECQRYSHRLNNCSCIEQQAYVLLAYLNCHMYILFVVVFTLVGWLVLGNDLLACLQSVVGCCWLLLLLLFIWYPVMALHQGRRSRWLTIRLVDWQRQMTISGIIHRYIFCIWGVRMQYLQFCVQVYLSLLLVYG